MPSETLGEYKPVDLSCQHRVLATVVEGAYVANRDLVCPPYALAKGYTEPYYNGGRLNWRTPLAARKAADGPIPPPWAVRRGYLTPIIRRDGRVHWINGAGHDWNAWPAEQDARLRSMHAKGLSHKVKARALGVSIDQIERRIKRLGIGKAAINAKDVKRAAVQVKLTADERKALDKLAIQSNTTVANYTRLLIRRAIGFQERL